MTGRIEVKICGLKEPAHAAVAVQAGADYVGVVFAERTRWVTIPEAVEVVSALDGGARVVGVFVDATSDEVLRHRDAVGFAIAQLHGEESIEMCRRLAAEGLGVWKAIRPKRREKVAPWWNRFACVADAVLMEGFSPEAAGGTGSSFPYEWLEDIDRASAALVLAGGLHPDNVGAAIEEVGPEVVDVSSGVERAPGEKSGERIRAFVEAVRTTHAAGVMPAPEG